LIREHLSYPVGKAINKKVASIIFETAREKLYISISSLDILGELEKFGE